MNLKNFPSLNRILKSKKSITISILKPIEFGLKKEDFLEKLQNEIYNELDSLN